MINQDEVFVITEDDILKPADKGKGKGGGPRAVSAKAAKASERQAESAETVLDRPAASDRVIDTIVNPISLDPVSAASSGFLPISM